MQKMKRFYKAAAAGPTDGGYGVLLDGRPVKTPAKAALAVVSKALAEAIAEEWQAQGDEIDTTSMSINNLTCTAIDIVGPQRQRIVEDLIDYGGHDLICYWSDEAGDLLKRQQQLWQPLLDWSSQNLSAPLSKTCGVISQEQPPASLNALRAAVEAHDALALTGLTAAAQAAGSLIIGLALSHRRLDAEEAHRLSQLDELYQAERWGEDAEAAARREHLRREMLAAGRFLELLRQDNGG